MYPLNVYQNFIANKILVIDLRNRKYVFLRAFSPLRAEASSLGVVGVDGGCISAVVRTTAGAGGGGISGFLGTTAGAGGGGISGVVGPTAGAGDGGITSLFFSGTQTSISSSPTSMRIFLWPGIVTGGVFTIALGATGTAGAAGGAGSC